MNSGISRTQRMRPMCSIASSTNATCTSGPSS
jgi:hypothetical protein